MPERFPLVNARPHVTMSIEESVHFGIHTPSAALEWLWTATVDDRGNVHMGPNGRFGVVGITHELHCLRALRDVLDTVDVPAGHDLHHSEHCLSFLREHTLCAADTTLEPPDAFARNYTRERSGGEHVCMDWDAFYGDMRTNYLEWDEFRKQEEERPAMMWA